MRFHRSMLVQAMVDLAHSPEHHQPRAVRPQMDLSPSGNFS